MAVNGTKVDRESHLRWVPIKEMRSSPAAQRKYRRTHAATYAADFHLEALGYPVLSLRDGIFFIVDGQHRIKALEMIGWGDQQIQCEVYEGLDAVLPLGEIETELPLAEIYDGVQFIPEPEEDP